MKPHLFLAAALLFVASWASAPASAQESLLIPDEGDPVIVYTHKFKPADFGAGKKLVIDGFTEAINDHGLDRLIFFLVDEHANEVVAISIFPDEEAMQAWQAAGVRHKVLEELEGARRQPLIFQHFVLESMHSINSGD